ncbi:P-loop NTPase [Veillonella denticariosi]|uniref:P-loop NTPase n=1 Tax=Veillonella denticariosi TaxID=419208 RepID=UPI002492E49E|nr:P-loop NTPase [Veillonella denticariosi]
MGEIIGVVSGKGGVGKTTVTACLGAALSNAGHRVLLCDGDFGLRDLDLVLGVADEVFYDALDASEYKEYADDAILPIGDNLDFLPASQKLRWEDMGRKKYKKLIKYLADRYDYVLIDAPAGIGKGIESILELVNRCIVVTHPLWVSLRNGARMIQVCEEANIRDHVVVFNSVPTDDADINLYDMLNVIRSEYVGAMIPYDEKVLRYTQNGTLFDLLRTDAADLLKPLVDYVISGNTWDEQDILDRFNAYAEKRRRAKELTPMSTLASSGNTIFEGNRPVRYINRNGWTTQRLVLDAKQSLWRRIKLK